MVYIYVLKLQYNKYYVGKTNNPQFRLENHFSSQGAEWTRLYKPVSLEALIPDCDDYDEDKYTRMYMDKYGVDNVRGGSYTQVVLDKGSKEQLTKMSNGTNDRCFACGKQGHFAKDCSTYSKDNQKCYVCGKSDHKTKDCTSNKWCCSICSMNFDTKTACIKHEYSCKKKSTVYFTYVDSDSDEDCYVYGNKYKKSKCFRCGREGHYSSSCYASTHIKGYYLNE
jgi:predicted GIY-YIG superfamily endonuclease